MLFRIFGKAPRPGAPPWAAALAVALLAPVVPCPAAAQLITGFEGFPPGENGVTMFRQPSFSGSTARFLAPSPNASVVTDERAFTGAQSLQVSWQFLPNQTDPWLRLTTFNTPNLPNPTLDFSLPLQFALFVPGDTPDFYLSLGVRETNTGAPIGANGGTVGEIEFVGATETRGMAPIGQLITTKDEWVLVTFDFASAPLQPFTGDGRLDVARGVLEHLAFTPVSAAAAGPYTVYLDEFVAVPEPTTAALVASGLLPLAGLAMRRRKRT